MVGFSAKTAGLGLNGLIPTHTARRPGLDVGQGWEDEGMDHDLTYLNDLQDTHAHDPLCFEYGVTAPADLTNHHNCQCGLISKVRTNERVRAANCLVQGVLIAGTPIFGCPICPDIWESEPSCEHYQIAEKFADRLRQQCRCGRCPQVSGVL